MWYILLIIKQNSLSTFLMELNLKVHFYEIPHIIKKKTGKNKVSASK